MKPEEFVYIALILLTGCIFLYATRQLLNGWLKLYLALALSLAAYVYTAYGQWDMIFPKDSAWKHAYGSQPKKVLFHWHENYHYYLGAKYFPEVGYKGLYETVAYADKISLDPTLTAQGMRSLRDPTYPVSMTEALRRGREEFRPNFTEERWASFVDDLETFKSTGKYGWLDIGLFDAGYNPPPSWAVYGHTMAELVPITQAQSWFGDHSPNWYQIEWVGVFDPIILAIAIGFVVWAFGWLGAVSFLFLFFMNEPANFGWIAGGFLRYTWLVFLMIGLSCLKKERYLPAGIFLGLSAADRIFPAAFLAGAALTLFANYTRNRDLRPLLRLCIGAGTSIAIIVGLSVLMFGMDAWVGFYEKIMAHKDLFFVNHIGYRRIAVYSQDILGQDFWWEPGLNRFRDWNAKLVAHWNEVRPLHMVLWAVLIIAASFASWRSRAEEAALMLGGLLFFLSEIAANYYYIYFPMIFVVILTATYTRLRQWLLAAFLLLWASLWYYHFASPDELSNNYYKCCAIFAFFCFWITTRAAETLSWIMGEQQELSQPQIRENP